MMRLHNHTSLILLCPHTTTNSSWLQQPWKVRWRDPLLIGGLLSSPPSSSFIRKAYQSKNSLGSQERVRIKACKLGITFSKDGYGKDQEQSSLIISGYINLFLWICVIKVISLAQLSWIPTHLLCTVNANIIHFYMSQAQ